MITENRIKKSQSIIKIMEATRNIGITDSICIKFKVMVCEFLKKFGDNDQYFLRQVQKIEGNDKCMLNELIQVMNSFIENLKSRKESVI